MAYICMLNINFFVFSGSCFSVLDLLIEYFFSDLDIFLLK